MLRAWGPHVKVAEFDSIGSKAGGLERFSAIGSEPGGWWEEVRSIE
jgi:hypothetical protein